ncbi:MAG: hypothetical protein H7Y38_14900 [Armatimonadetes bacterium]|nr:hypothetical protein [Armatimonadota bacterium]
MRVILHDGAVRVNATVLQNNAGPVIIQHPATPEYQRILRRAFRELLTEKPTRRTPLRRTKTIVKAAHVAA